MTDYELLKLYEDKAATVCGKPRGLSVGWGHAEYLALAERHMIDWLAEYAKDHGNLHLLYALHRDNPVGGEWVHEWLVEVNAARAFFKIAPTLFEALVATVIEAGKEKVKP